MKNQILRRILALAIFCAFLVPTMLAQDTSETKYLLKGSGATKINAFAGPTLTFSTAYKTFRLFLGGEAGITINRILLIGGYGEWYMGDYQESVREMIGSDNELLDNFKVQLKFNHAGFKFGYLYKSQNPIHFGITSRFGWGKLRWEPVEDVETPIELTDNVFVITPRLEVGLNMAPWVKMFVAGGYRFVTGINETYESRRPSSSYIRERGLFSTTALDSYVIDVGFYFGNF